MIPVAQPSVGPEEAAAAAAVLSSGWLTQGPQVAEFERRLAEYCGVGYAVAVSNCTTALHLALVALGVGPGDEVVCPSMSFIASANAVRHTGAVPVFADVDQETYNLDPDAVEAVLTDRTRVIMPVHQLGLPADLDRFLALGDRYGIPILEDAACAIGSAYKGRKIGGHGAAACFSFHPRKVLTTGEGGMITTNDEGFARRLRLLRQHGMSISDVARHSAKQVVEEEYVCVGYNYRMTDIQAAVGIEQLKKLDAMLASRRRLARRYTSALSSQRWLVPPLIPDYAEPNFQSYAVSLREGAPVSRNTLMQRLLDCGIATRRGVMLAHTERAYADLPSRELPCSQRASKNSLILPIYAHMKDEQQDLVIRSLQEAFTGA